MNTAEIQARIEEIEAEKVLWRRRKLELMHISHALESGALDESERQRLISRGERLREEILGAPGRRKFH